MRQFARLSVLLLTIVALVTDKAPSYALAIQQQPQKQPGPGKKFVSTPFGVDEVDLSDPRPGIAFGPPSAPVQPGPAAAQPQAAPAQAQPGQDTDPVIPVQLHFDNGDLPTVVKTIAMALQINYVVDPAVRGGVNLEMNTQMRRSDLFAVLETILKVNNATMVRSGNFYQIVPAAAAIRMPLEVQQPQPAAAPDDQIVIQVVPMKFVTANEMATLLTPFLSDSGNLVAQGGSILLITDRRSNLRKLLEIVDLFDTQAFQGERVRILPIKNNRVRDVIDDLKTVFGGYALSNNTAIRFLPIERMNSVVVVTGNPAVFPEVERWVDRLDQPIQTAGLRNYVYRPKNTKAEDLQKVLSLLYGDESFGIQNAPPLPNGGLAAGQAPPANATAAQVLSGGQSQGPATAVASARLAGQLRIIADTVNNQLVIQASSQDYQAIERTLQELDVLPRQVLIDAQIYEVNLDHTLSLGLSAILQNRGTLANAQTTAQFTGATGLSATTFAFIGRSRELVAFLNATENRSRVKTLSAPSILVSNNAEAQVQIGAEVPIPTSTAASGAQQGGSTLFAQTIQFRDTGVILTVRPQINEGGNLTLEIAQEVSQAGANTTSSINAPVIGKSSVRSTIVVRDGETIPLTGFIRENELYGRNRVPLLGSIPIAGLLFGNTTKSKSRSELIILITPHVVTTVDERAAAADELKAKLKETKPLLR